MTQAMCEYISVLGYSAAELADHLTRHASEGWREIAIIPSATTPGYVEAILKREITKDRICAACGHDTRRMDHYLVCKAKK